MVSSRVATVKLSPQSKRFIQQIKKAGLSDELFAEILKLWDKEAAKIASHISKTKLSGQRKFVRSGTLRKSIVGLAEKFRGVPAMRVGVLRGPAVRYAGIQEYGTKKFNPRSPYGTIKPKTSRYLAFPPSGSPALFPSGVPRYAGPREYPGKLVFIPYKNGKNAVGGLYDASDLKAARNDGGASLRDIQTVYVLLRKMDVRPGFFLRDGMTERLPDVLVATGNLIESFFNRTVA